MYFVRSFIEAGGLMSYGDDRYETALCDAHALHTRLSAFIFRAAVSAACQGASQGQPTLFNKQPIATLLRIAGNSRPVRAVLCVAIRLVDLLFQLQEHHASISGCSEVAAWPRSSA